MTYLLDTHTSLWTINNNPKLPEGIAQLIEDGEHELYLSVISLWEIAIKVSLGKLELDIPFSELSVYANKTDISWLPIKQNHLNKVIDPPFHHRDPFDRLLVAQSLTEDLTFLTRDSALAAYGVKIRWA